MPRPTVIPSDPGSASDPTALQHRTVHGYRRAFRMCGDGPALVLLHGIGDSSDGWREVMEPLAEHFTVVAPDLLGHGASDKPRADYSVAAYANGVRDLMDVLGIDTATVVGHSLGGGVAAQTTYQYPHRVERLVLVATGGVSREVTPFLRLLSAPFAELALQPLGLPGAHLASRVVAAGLRASGTDLGRDADELLRVFDNLPRGSARTSFTRTLRSVVDWRGQVVTMLDRCYLADDLPTLIMWGDRDPVVPFAHAALAHEAMPTSRLEVFEGAGHFPHHADPDRFVELVVDFVASTAPARFDRRRWTRTLRSGGRPGPVGIHDRADDEDEGAIVG